MASVPTKIRPHEILTTTQSPGTGLLLSKTMTWQRIAGTLLWPKTLESRATEAMEPNTTSRIRNGEIKETTIFWETDRR